MKKCPMYTAQKYHYCDTLYYPKQLTDSVQFPSHGNSKNPETPTDSRKTRTAGQC